MEASSVSGLAAPDNDPALVSLAKSALACPLGDGDSGFDSECEAFRAWEVTKLLVATGGPPRDATLVNMTEDTDVRVRRLGALGLGRADDYRTRPGLAVRLVAALRKETFIDVAALLARSVSRVDLEKTGTTDTVLQLARTHGSVQVRRSLVAKLYLSNPKSRPAFLLTTELAKELDEVIRFDAADQLTFGGAGTDAEICALWETCADDLVPTIAGRCARSLGASKQCAGSRDRLLHVAESRLSRTEAMPHGVVEGVYRMCEADGVLPPQRLRGAAIGRAVASSRAETSIVRVTGLQAVARCDLEQGREFAKIFVNDEDALVSKTARQLASAKR